MRPGSHVSDSGETVTVDLHGLTVEAALDVARRVLAIAQQRGRSSVKLIHGSSTTDRDGQNRTIKTALTELTRAGGMRGLSVFASTDYLIIGLPASSNRETRRITALDVF